MIDDRLWDFAQYLLEGDVLLQGDIEVLLQVRLSDLKTGEINGLERLIRRERLSKGNQARFIRQVLVLRDV